MFLLAGDWGFQEFNQEPDAIQAFLEANDAGNTSVPYRQNRALMFDSMLFHQSDPFRFKKGILLPVTRLLMYFGFQIELKRLHVVLNDECSSSFRFLMMMMISDGDTGDD